MMYEFVKTCRTVHLEVHFPICKLTFILKRYFKKVNPLSIISLCVEKDGMPNLALLPGRMVLANVLLAFF